MLSMTGPCRLVQDKIQGFSVKKQVQKSGDVKKLDWKRRFSGRVQVRFWRPMGGRDLGRLLICQMSTERSGPPLLSESTYDPSAKTYERYQRSR